MAADDKDIYQRFEIAVRTPKRRLLVDAFLPAPETLESAVTPPPPPPLPEAVAEDLGVLARLDAGEPPPPPRPRAKKKRRGDETILKDKPKSLQEEIAEFMNRDKPPGGAAEDDLDSFLNPSLDPNTDPESKK